MLPKEALVKTVRTGSRSGAEMRTRAGRRPQRGDPPVLPCGNDDRFVVRAAARCLACGAGATPRGAATVSVSAARCREPLCGDPGRLRDKSHAEQGCIGSHTRCHLRCAGTFFRVGAIYAGPCTRQATASSPRSPRWRRNEPAKRGSARPLRLREQGTPSSAWMTRSDGP